MGQALDPELEEHLEQAHGQIPASQADGRWRPSALVKRENPAARRALQQCRPGRQRQRRLLAFLSCRGHRESCVSWLPRDVARLICGLVPREALFVFGGRAMSESDDAAGEDGRMSLTAACWRLERGQWTRLGDAPQPFFGASVAVLPDGWMLLTSCVTFSAAGYATSARVLLTDGREHWEDVTAGTLARGEGCACACYGNSVVVLGGSNRRPDRRYRLVRETGCLGEHLRLPQRPNAQELTRVRCVLYGSFLIALSFNGGCGNDESQPETVSACDCCAALECIDLSDPAGDWFSLRKLPASRLHVTNCHLSVQVREHGTIGGGQCVGGLPLAGLQAVPVPLRGVDNVSLVGGAGCGGDAGARPHPHALDRRFRL